MRGIELGITLEAFESGELPQEPDRKKVRVSCEVKKNKKPDTLNCFLASDRTSVGAPHSHELTLGNTRSTDVQFFFTRGKDDTLRLTEILFRAEMNKLDAIYAPLREKYGAPQIAEGEVQNAFGTAFGTETARWVNGISAITLKTRCEKTYLFCLRYTDIGLMGMFVNKMRKNEIPRESRL